MLSYMYHQISFPYYTNFICQYMHINWILFWTHACIHPMRKNPAIPLCVWYVCVYKFSVTNHWLDRCIVIFVQQINGEKNSNRYRAIMWINAPAHCSNICSCGYMCSLLILVRSGTSCESENLRNDRWWMSVCVFRFIFMCMHTPNSSDLSAKFMSPTAY